MTLSLYHASVPVFSQMLNALAGVLAKAETNAIERKFDPAVLLNARLAPDMLALTRQVQIATDHAKGAPSRLAGRDNPVFEDNETTFAELQARIARTRDHLKGLAEADFVGSEDRTISLKVGQRELTFPATQYLYHFALPNFYFHITTAYNILRHNGVPLTKGAFLGAP